MATKTNRKPLHGNNVSHSHRRTRRKQKLNIKSVIIDGEKEILTVREARSLKKSNEKAA